MKQMAKSKNSVVELFKPLGRDCSVFTEIANPCRVCFAKVEAGLITNVISNTSYKRQSVQLQELIHIAFMQSKTARFH